MFQIKSKFLLVAYSIFTGRDASRAFVTGDFSENGLTDIVDDLSPQELRSLNNWLQFYHKTYIFKGKMLSLVYFIIYKLYTRVTICMKGIFSASFTPHPFYSFIIHRPAHL